MRICIDLDGVIAGFKQPGQTYADVAPIEGAIDKLKELKANGHHIIIFTARHMKTCEANVGKVVARVGLQTLDWLERHGVVYDEIFFGKPWADIYIDDNAFRFSNWDEIDGNGESLPVSNEKKQKANYAATSEG